MKFLPFFCVFLFVLSACGQSNPLPNNASKAIPSVSENKSSEIQKLSVDIIQGAFRPNQLTVKKGIPVEITLKAIAIDPEFHEHGFSIREFGINEKIPLGETRVVKFTPDKTGTFTFFCSVFCGEGHRGQSGILTVVEK